MSENSDDTKALVERVMELEEVYRAHVRQVRADSARIAELERELAEAQRDARRYRWLRDYPLRRDFGDMAPWWHVSKLENGIGHCYREGALDAAIDAAMEPT